MSKKLSEVIVLFKRLSMKLLLALINFKIKAEL